MMAAATKPTNAPIQANFFSCDFGERSNNAHTTFSSERVLRNDEWDAPDEQKDNPCNQKRAGTVIASILGGDAWESPDVAGSDSDAEYAQE